MGLGRLLFTSVTSRWFFSFFHTPWSATLLWLVEEKWFSITTTTQIVNHLLWGIDFNQKEVEEMKLRTHWLDTVLLFIPLTLDGFGLEGGQWFIVSNPHYNLFVYSISSIYLYQPITELHQGLQRVKKRKSNNPFRYSIGISLLIEINSMVIDFQERDSFLDSKHGIHSTCIHFMGIAWLMVRLRLLVMVMLRLESRSFYYK